MARAAPNVESRISNLSGIARGGVGRDSTRRYLRSQLRQLDAQIEALMYAQKQESWRMLERAMWLEPSVSQIVWAGRLELHYLQAVREALVESLMRL